MIPPIYIILLLPLLEIAGFVIVGQWLGVLPTLMLVIATTALGIFVLRSNGVSLANRLRRRGMGTPEDAARSVVDGTAQAFGGLLLILPGFITDILGLLLLVPMVRARLWDRLKPKLRPMGGRGGFGQGPQPTAQSQPGPTAAPDIVDLGSDEYQRQPPKGPSPWSGRPQDKG